MLTTLWPCHQCFHGVEPFPPASLQRVPDRQGQRQSRKHALSSSCSARTTNRARQISNAPAQTELYPLQAGAISMTAVIGKLHSHQRWRCYAPSRKLSKSDPYLNCQVKKPQVQSPQSFPRLQVGFSQKRDSFFLKMRLVPKNTSRNADKLPP